MPPAMQVHRPTVLAEALEMLRDHEDAKVLAGGTAFTLFHRLGLLAPEHVVVTKGLTELHGVRHDGVGLVIGAMTTLRDVELDPLVLEELPILAHTLRLVANLRVRNVATIGGNLAEADPSSDPPAVLVALDASVRLARIGGERVVPLTHFFHGFLETDVADDELVTEVIVPRPPGTCSYVKFVSRHAEDRTCLGAAAIVATDRRHRLQTLRLCVIGSDSTPLRVPELEEGFRGRRLDDETMREVARSYAERSNPVSDHRGTSDYRRRVMEPLIVEALRVAAAGGDEAVRW